MMAAGRRTAVVRVGIPTVAVAALATTVMVAVNYATNDTTTGPIAWGVVVVVTLGSAVASFCLYRRTEDTPDTAPAAGTAPSSASGAGVQISGNTFLGPTAVQGSGEQRNRFGS